MRVGLATAHMYDYPLGRQRGEHAAGRCDPVVERVTDLSGRLGSGPSTSSRVRACGAGLPSSGWLGRSPVLKGIQPAGWLSSPPKGRGFSQRVREDSGIAGSGSPCNADTDTLDIRARPVGAEVYVGGAFADSASGVGQTEFGVLHSAYLGPMWLVVKSFQPAAGVAGEGRVLTLARGRAVRVNVPHQATDCPGHGPRGQTDPPTRTTRIHLAPRSRCEGAHQRLWDIVPAQVHHPDPDNRADRRHRTRARTEVGP